MYSVAESRQGYITPLHSCKPPVEVTFGKPASVGMTPEAQFPSASVTVADSVPGLYSKLGSWGSTSSANEPSFCEVSPDGDTLPAPVVPAWLVKIAFALSLLLGSSPVPVKL